MTWIPNDQSHAPLSDYPISAAQTSAPQSGDSVSVVAPLAVDTNDSDLLVALYDDTTAEARRVDVHVPAGTARCRVTTTSRPETAPGGAKVVKRDIHCTTVAAAGASAPTTLALPDTAITTDENWITDSDVVELADMGLTAGQDAVILLVRDSADGDDTLSGDWALLSMRLEFL